MSTVHNAQNDAKRHVVLLLVLPLDAVKHLAARQHAQTVRATGSRWHPPRPAVAKKIARNFVRHALTDYDDCRLAEPERRDEFWQQVDGIVREHYPELATQADADNLHALRV